MERKIGEIFEYNGEWYQCVEQPKQYDCATVFELCAFSAVGNCELDKCSGTYRSDSKSVIFKKLEKVGDPIRIENKSYQKIKVPGALCNNCAFCDNFSRDCKLNDYINYYPTYSCLIDEMFVEIKQNKENMGEKKLNLKPFDLEAAKAGKPVCTRDGRKARIICFDLNNKNFPIVAIINCDTEENAYQYDIDGVCDEHDNNLNLMMSPEKKEGYVNIYTNPRVGDRYSSNTIFPSKEEAIQGITKSLGNYINTTKIEWEE